MEFTLPTVAEKSLTDLAIKRALRKGVDEQEELEAVKSEFRKLGAYLTSFDSGTTPAVKQFRHQLLMSGIGSINFEVDEIGNNLLGNKEIVDVYLELFDGSVKPKLTKNTADSTSQLQTYIFEVKEEPFMDDVGCVVLYDNNGQALTSVSVPAADPTNISFSFRPPPLS